MLDIPHLNLNCWMWMSLGQKIFCSSGSMHTNISTVTLARKLVLPLVDRLEYNDGTLQRLYMSRRLMQILGKSRDQHEASNPFFSFISELKLNVCIILSHIIICPFSSMLWQVAKRWQIHTSSCMSSMFIF